MSRLVLSPPLCCWSASTSCFCNHARARSGVEHTSSVSTGTVREPCDRYAVCSLLVLVVMRDWCWARVWLEQRASPSLLADRLGALIHSLRCISAFVSSRFSRSRPLPSCFCMHHEVNHRVTRLFFQVRSDLARGFAASDLSHALLSSGCSCMGRRIVELIKITDVAC